MRYRNVFIGLILLLFVVGLSGCFSAKPDDINAFLRPDEAEVTAEDYPLQPPDQITVISSKVPELQGTTRSVGHTQTIRPDGYVSFETVGEIYVAGKTPRQVAEMIAEKLSKLYSFTSEYPIDVRVARNFSKYYYILGMVRNRGAQAYTGRETTLSAISKAIPNVQAWEEEIQIIRPTLALAEKPKIFKLNFKRMLEHGDMSGNVLLQEGDIIYVPPTILASIGLTLQEIVGPLRGGASILADVQVLSN
ncbi:MAG: polysaccharide biosynthesis/export family protein [Planctomycetota bacterium]|jgi:polysaccharide export outer membrane protein